MYNPFGGNKFPYANFHELNLDWIIQIAKDFLDQYSHIEETLDEGLQSLEDKATELEGLLDAWYTEHSEDIATQLAQALADLNTWYTTHEGYLDQYLQDSVTAFNTAAAAKAAETIATIPEDYTALFNQVQSIQTAFNINEKFMFVDGKIYSYNTDIVFEQGNFTSQGDDTSTTWIRTPKNSKLPSDFVIYNPYRLQYAVAAFYGNEFQGYVNAGTEVVVPSVFRDQYCKVIDNTHNFEYRIRVSNYMASGDLTPAASTLRVFTPYHTEDKNVFRTVNVATGNGAIISGSPRPTPGDNYRYTDVIKLYAGETIHFEYAGPTNMIALSTWTPTADGSDPKFNYDSALIYGDNGYHVAEYTAESDMYVRVSTMIAPVHNKPYTNSTDTVSNIYIFRADDFYDKTDPLYGKSITVMGDSMTYGSICGPEAIWLQRLALKHNMNATNMGVNGNAITEGYGTGDAMSVRYVDIPESDYIVIQGGANDKRENAPTGTFWADETHFVMNTDTSTFMGALNTIISGLRTMYPKAKLVCLTDYDRYPSKWHVEADAMKEVCRMRSVPCFDNFSDSGVALCEAGLSTWQDEGIWLDTTANYHLTPEVYRDVLLPKYEDLLKHI